MLRTTTPLGIPLGLKIVLSFCFASQISQFQKARRRAGRVVDLKVPNVYENRAIFSVAMVHTTSCSMSIKLDSR